MEKINFVSEADAFWKNLSNQSDDSQVRRMSFQLPSDILTFVILLSYFRLLCFPIHNNPLLNSSSSYISQCGIYYLPDWNVG